MHSLRCVLACIAWKLASSHDGEKFHEEAIPLPDLSGVWSTGDPAEKVAMQIHHPLDLPARPTNASYVLHVNDKKAVALCILDPIFSYETRQRMGTQIQCTARRGHSLRGLLPAIANSEEAMSGWADDAQIKWKGGASWGRLETYGAGNRRYDAVRKVHVVFANHYDVGYTAFLNDVDNRYLHDHYPAAEKLANETRAPGNGTDKYVYMTHPWMTQRFLECPCRDAASACPARSLNNTFAGPLECPSDEDMQNLRYAAESEAFVFNAAPFNIQPENMAPELLDASLAEAARVVSAVGGKPGKTVSIRDVMYVTRPTLARLAAAGVVMLTVGSNPACVPPQVPKLHLWRDNETGAEVIVAYHPFGYSGTNLNDCAIAPNGVALCTDFRSDNTGPHSQEEFADVMKKVRQEYPGAEVVSSTFDAFAADVLPVKENLTVVDLEVGDTWIYGDASDPLKMAQHRAMQRVLYSHCKDGQGKNCSLDDPVVRNFTFFMLKAPEHTWGTAGIAGWTGGEGDYDHFRENLTSYNLMHAAAGWAEQRFFNELAVRALEEGKHPLAALVREELAALENATAPSLTGFQQVPVDTDVRLGDHITVKFGGDGSIVRLSDGYPSGREWATEERPIAQLVYQTFNDTEWLPFTYSYMNDHQMQGGFCKPGSNNFTESAYWHPEIKELWIHGTAASTADTAVAVVDFPEKASTKYGAPKRVYLQVQPQPDTEGLDALQISLIATDKLPTIVGEALMLAFQTQYKLAPQGSGSAWSMEKMGHYVDPEGVVDGGNQFQHGVWKDVKVSTEAGTMTVEAVDSATMSPITADFPFGNPLPATYKESSARAGTGMSRLAAGSVVGMAANLHNNLWNTNYALYYPYYDSQYCDTPLTCRNRNMLFRFRVGFSPPSPKPEIGVMV